MFVLGSEELFVMLCSFQVDAFIQKSSVGQVYPANTQRNSKFLENAKYQKVTCYLSSSIILWAALSVACDVSSVSPLLDFITNADEAAVGAVGGETYFHAKFGTRMSLSFGDIIMLMV